ATFRDPQFPKCGVQRRFRRDELCVVQSRDPAGVDVRGYGHGVPPSGLVTKRDPTASEIVRRDGDRDTIARQNADAKLPNLPSGGGEETMPVVEVDAEHRAREYLRDRAFELDGLLLHADLERPVPRRSLCLARWAACDLSWRAALGFT